MKLRNIISTVILVPIVLTAIGTYFGWSSENEFTNVYSYSDVWKQGNRYTEKYTGDNTVSPLFPAEITDPDNSELYCFHSKDFPFAETFQIKLTVKYQNQETFDEEIVRLSSLYFEDGIGLDKDGFSLPAYITALDWNYCSEYALVDEKTRTVHYIYLQNANMERMKLDAALLPEDFNEFGDVGGVDFCIYE